MVIDFHDLVSANHLFPFVLGTFHSNDSSLEVLVSSSRLFEHLKDDKSAEVVLLACLMLRPDYTPALLSYGRLAARQVRLFYIERVRGRDHVLVRGSNTEA